MVGFIFDDAMILTMIFNTSAIDAFTICGGDCGFQEKIERLFTLSYSSSSPWCMQQSLLQVPFLIQRLYFKVPVCWIFCSHHSTHAPSCFLTFSGPLFGWGKFVTFEYGCTIAFFDSTLNGRWEEFDWLVYQLLSLFEYSLIFVTVYIV